MLVIKQAVERLDRLEVSHCPALLHIGFKHKDKQDVCAEHFHLFKDSIVYIWKHVLKEKLLPDVLEAWEVLLDYIILGLTYGFHAS